MESLMTKVISHRWRYEVQYFSEGEQRWKDYSSHRFAWNAKRVARHREGLGFFTYRVVDTHG